MKKILISLAALTLLATGLVGAAHYRYALEPLPGQHQLTTTAGSHITIHAHDYVKGHIEKTMLRQISGLPLEFRQTSAGVFEIAIPRHYRGITASFELSGMNALFTEKTTLVITTPLIGKIKTIVVSSGAACWQDESGVYCQGMAGNQPVSPPDTVTQEGTLIAGDQHFCSRETDRLVCWGSINLDEELPAGANVATGGSTVCFTRNDRLQCHGDSYITRQMPEVGNIEKITVGGQHACVLANHMVKCWGRNHEDDDPITQGFFYPTDIASGYFFSCALDAGQVQCWGPASPQLNRPPLGEVSAIKASGDKICARVPDGWTCWNPEGKVNRFSADQGFSPWRSHYCLMSEPACFRWENGRQENRQPLPTPLSVENPHRLRSEGKTSCFLSGETMFCRELEKQEEHAANGIRDFDLHGQTRCEMTDHIQCHGALANVPVPKALTAPDKLVTARDVACALQQGKVYCWGHDTDLTSVPPLNDVKDIALGGSMINRDTDGTWACAVYTQGIRCWGRNPLVDADYPQVNNPTAIALNNYKACVIDDQKVKCWSRSRGKVTMDKLGNHPLKDPIAITIASLESVCVIDEQQVKCTDIFGEAIEALPLPISQPTEIAGNLMEVCAIDDNGLTCFGNNYFRYARR